MLENPTMKRLPMLTACLLAWIPSLQGSDAHLDLLKPILDQSTALGILSSIRASSDDGRASGNFSTENPPTNTRFIEVVVIQDDALNHVISFKLRLDRKNLWDEDWIKNVKNRTVIAYDDHRKVFVDSVDGAALKPFTLYLIAHSGNPAATRDPGGQEARRRTLRLIQRLFSREHRR